MPQGFVLEPIYLFVRIIGIDFCTDSSVSCFTDEMWVKLDTHHAEDVEEVQPRSLKCGVGTPIFASQSSDANFPTLPTVHSVKAEQAWQ